jgi:hypothetical protein
MELDPPSFDSYNSKIGTLSLSSLYGNYKDLKDTHSFLLKVLEHIGEPSNLFQIKETFSFLSSNKQSNTEKSEEHFLEDISVSLPEKNKKEKKNFWV